MSGKVVPIRGNTLERDTLVLAHLDLVAKIARKLKEKLPPCFELDDLIGYGWVGLMQAASKFDPARGVAFGAYARRRIKGEMLEAIGMHSSAGLNVRSTRRLTRRRRWDEATRPPIAEHDDKSHCGCQEVESERATTPDSRVDLNNVVEMRKREDMVDAAIATLPTRHAVLIEMHYRRDVPLRQIAGMELFGVTHCRTNQIHGEAISKLRDYFVRRGQRAA